MPAQVVDLTNLPSGDGFTVVGDAAYDRAGISVSGAGDVNGDGIDDFIVSARYNDRGGNDAGRTYVVFGTSSATRPNIDLTNFSSSDGFYVDGIAGDASGAVVAVLGDVNGDGIDDFAISSTGAAAGSAANSGAVWVIFGKAGATRGNLNLGSLSPTDGFIIIGDASGDAFGSALAGAGDVNSDGIADIVIGAPFGDDGGPNAGEAYLIFGRAGATRTNIDVTTLAAADGFVLVGNLDDERAGRSVSSAGDINGDGIEDFLVGAPYSDDGGNIRGKVYVVFGEAGATRANIDFSNFTASSGFTIRGAQSPDVAGHAMSSVGDINGDGIDDILITAYRQNSATGAAYVIFGKVGGTRANIELSSLAATDGFLITGDAIGDNFGFSAAGAGDVNGDGINDLIVGAPRGDDGGDAAGEAYVILGRAGATRANIDVTTLAPADGFIIQGDSLNDQAGRAVAAAGDINQDGFDDILVGAHFDATGGVRAGAAYVIYGSRFFGITPIEGDGQNNVLNGTSGTDVIIGLAGDDQLNGGGGSDRLVGGDGNDILDGGAGADQLIGGANDDIYIVDDAGDVVIENPGEGNDEVRTTLATYVLPANVERLVYTGGGPGQLSGNSGDNIVTGGDAGDVFNLSQGGSDSVSGGGGDDGFYFGSAYTSADVVDGGAGTRDQIGLQGDYGAGVTLGSIAQVEMIVLLAGNDGRFGDTAGASYSYNITSPDTSVAAGQRLIVQANALRSGENLTFDGSAETDGYFLIFGGRGIDNLTGGAGNDGFFFGQGGFGSSDVVNGGTGTLDQLGLQGNYTGGNAIIFGAGQLSGIEFIVLLSANDNRFSSVGGTASYDLTMNDANLAAGQRLIVSANTLTATETLSFRGLMESDASFTIYSGAGDDFIAGGQLADEIWGGSGNDFIEGQGGADILRGGAGNDTFHYLQASHSTNSARDQILDFALGDKIDLGGLAANTGGGSFSFIGDGAQTGARQVQVSQTGNQATVLVYIDADSSADLVIDVTVVDGHSLTSADFTGAVAQIADVDKALDAGWTGITFVTDMGALHSGGSGVAGWAALGLGQTHEASGLSFIDLAMIHPQLVGTNDFNL